MNIKPTEQQVRKWAEGAGKYADMKRKTWEAWDLLRDQKLAELAAAWGAEQAQPNATPRKSMAYTPRQEQIIMVCDILHRISESYDHWKGWSGIQSNCEQAINLLRYDSTQAQQPTVEEPELPEAAAWKPVVGFEGLYSVSTNGDIVNNKTGKQIAKNSTGAGYIKADLFKDGLRTQTSAHRVVAAAFLGSLEGKEVNHKDGDKTNNKLSNLELVTRQENVLHGYYALGHLVKPVIGTCIKTGEKKRYASLSEVRNDGFKPTHVASCASKIPTHNTHKGWTWEFETAAQMHEHYAAGVRAGAAESQAAKRYRWLRDEARNWAGPPHSGSTINGGMEIVWTIPGVSPVKVDWRLSPESLDAAIDAAMQGGQQP